MRPAKLSYATRELKPPQDWNYEEPCDNLSILDYESDNGNVMVSAWIPDEEELHALKNGAVIFLHVHGQTHPPVALTIKELP